MYNDDVKIKPCFDHELQLLGCISLVETVMTVTFREDIRELTWLEML